MHDDDAGPLALRRHLMGIVAAAVAAGAGCGSLSIGLRGAGDDETGGGEHSQSDLPTAS